MPAEPSPSTLDDIEYRWSRDNITTFIAVAEVARLALDDVPALIRLARQQAAEVAALRDLIAREIPGVERSTPIIDSSTNPSPQ